MALQSLIIGQFALQKWFWGEWVNYALYMPLTAPQFVYRKGLAALLTISHLQKSLDARMESYLVQLTSLVQPSIVSGLLFKLKIYWSLWQCAVHLYRVPLIVDRESWLMVLWVSGSQWCVRHATLKCVGPSSIYYLFYKAVKCLSCWTDHLPIQTTPHYWQLLASQQTHAVTASFSRASARIQEWCNHWCMILNLNKTKVIVVGRSRTVSNPDGALVLRGVSIRASPNLNILGVKFDGKLNFEDHVCGIVFLGILRLVNLIFVSTCCVIAILLCSSNPCIVFQCGGQLLNVTVCFLSAGCIRWPGFVLTIVACCWHVARLSMLYMVNLNNSSVQQASICFH